MKLWYSYCIILERGRAIISNYNINTLYTFDFPNLLLIQDTENVLLLIHRLQIPNQSAILFSILSSTTFVPHSKQKYLFCTCYHCINQCYRSISLWYHRDTIRMDKNSSIRNHHSSGYWIHFLVHFVLVIMSSVYKHSMLLAYLNRRA